MTLAVPDIARALTRQHPFLCPELELWLLDPEHDLHRATDPEALGMPYWAFAWPGGQVLARYVLDHPDLVRGRRVLDLGSGCAIEGLAAARCGAREVLCADLDPLAATAAERNAALASVSVHTTTDNLLDAERDGFDVILAGDVCYSPELAQRVRAWLGRRARAGATVLLGDPLRVPGLDEGFPVLASWDASFDGDPRGLTLWRTHVLAVPPL